MSDDLFEQYREALVPQGTLPLVRLTLGGCAFYSHDFIKQVINEMETKVRLAAAGLEELTASDCLVLEVLKYSMKGVG